LIKDAQLLALQNTVKDLACRLETLTHPVRK
jgi:hypothetical protein